MTAIPRSPGAPQPPTLEELVPKCSLGRLHLRSYPGAAKLSPQRWATETQRLQAVLEFPPATQLLLLDANPAGAAPRRNPALISHRRETVVNRQNLYIRLITRRFVNQPKIISPLTRMDRKTSHMHMSDKTLDRKPPTLI